MGTTLISVKVLILALALSAGLINTTSGKIFPAQESKNKLIQIQELQHGELQYNPEMKQQQRKTEMDQGNTKDFPADIEKNLSKPTFNLTWLLDLARSIRNSLSMALQRSASDSHSIPISDSDFKSQQNISPPQQQPKTERPLLNLGPEHQYTPKMVFKEKSEFHKTQIGNVMGENPRRRRRNLETEIEKELKSNGEKLGRVVLDKSREGIGSGFKAIGAWIIG